MEELVKKIAGATAQLRDWVADKTNKEQGYDYISADQVLSRCGAALSKVGVVVIPAIKSHDVGTVEYKRANGSVGYRYTATVAMSLMVTDGKSQFEVLWPGMGTDFSSPEKAIYKAVTTAHKYFLMKLLCVGVGNEDGEHEHENVEEPAAPKLKAPKVSKEAVWKRWHDLSAEARALGIQVVELGPGTSIEDVIANGKSLADYIRIAKNQRNDG